MRAPNWDFRLPGNTQCSFVVQVQHVLEPKICKDSERLRFPSPVWRGGCIPPGAEEELTTERREVRAVSSLRHSFKSNTCVVLCYVVLTQQKCLSSHTSLQNIILYYVISYHTILHCIVLCNPFLLSKKPPQIVNPPEVFIIRGRFLANVPQK